MAYKSNGPSSIPVWLVVLAWFLYAPAGLILTIIKLFPYIKELLSTTSSASSKSQAAQSVPYTIPSSSGDKKTYYASMTSSPGTATHYASTYRKENGEKKPESKEKDKIKTDVKEKKKDTSRNTGSKLLRIFGYIALGIAAVVLIMGIPDIMTVSWLTDTLPAAALFGLTGCGLILGGHGRQNAETRKATIRLLIGQRDSLNLNKLAAATGVSLKKTVKDVQSLIDNGEFGKEAYIDLATENFMRNPNAVPDSPAQFDCQEPNGQKDKKENSAAAPKPVKDDFEMASDNEKYRETIREIRRLNVEIKDEKISEKIYEIEGYSKTIFEFVSSHPEEESKIRTFMNYYLPTTLKLLESYSEIEKVGVAGENMQKSKENIEATMDMMATAFKLQLDDLFKSESIDISSDISVLEAMVNKDGLSGKNDFDISDFSDDIVSGNHQSGSAAPDPRPEEK